MESNSLILFIFNVMMLQYSRATYVASEPCKENTCVYNYVVSGYIHGEQGKEVSEIRAQVHLRCESIGVFEGREAHYYCIDVKNMSSTLTSVPNNTNKDEIVEQRGMGGTNEAELANEKEYIGSLISQQFCFIRNTNGKVLSVHHPTDEDPEVVNFKKTIVSAFQANFAETETEEEVDSQSHHTSHYSYSQREDKKVEHRTINKQDVSEFSGTVSKQAVDFKTVEKIEVDENLIIHRSQGESRVSMSSRINDTDAEDESDNDEEANLNDGPPMETSSSYTLELDECLATTENDDDVSSQSSRKYRSTVRWKRKATKDTLLARIDQRKHDMSEMAQLHDSLPELEETARRAARSVDGAYRKDKGRDLLKWRRLLWLESKHGAVPGKKPKLFLLTEVLDKIQHDDVEESKQLRLLIYSLLSSEGSLKAQKSLWNTFEQCTDLKERKNLLMAISMSSSIHPSIVSKFEHFIKSANADMKDELLLVYAILGRHKNVENQILDLIVNELNMLMARDHGINTTSDVIHLLHTLGNTGSKQIIPYVSPFLLSSNEDVKLVAIDSLRTVSREESVIKMFKNLVDFADSIKTIAAVVESVSFPLKNSLYFAESPADVTLDESEVHLSLMESMTNASIRFNSPELTKVISDYLKYVGTPKAKDLLEDLKITRSNIHKRAITTNWSSSYALYNLIASQSSRSADKLNYPCHKAILWAKKLGGSKIYARLTVGGFSGMGSGHKIHAKGVVKLHAYGYKYEAVNAEYTNRAHIINGYLLKRYIKVCGTTHVNTENSISAPSLPYEYSLSKNLYNIQLFYAQFSIWIWVGTLNIYIGANIDFNADLSLTLNSTKATGDVDFTHTASVTGGAEVHILIWKVGLEITASIDYSVLPYASIQFCTANAGSLEACFGIYRGSNGVSIDIYAFYKSWGCKWSWWKVTCGWSGKKKLSLFSNTYALSSIQKSLLLEKCGQCTCSP